MEALAMRLLRPPPSVDELFVLMRERKEHVLTGGPTVGVLKTAAQRLVSNFASVGCRREAG
jgi:hypothetical protein